MQENLLKNLVSSRAVSKIPYSALVVAQGALFLWLERSIVEQEDLGSI